MDQTTSTKFEFFRTPFVLLTISLAIGIILGYELNESVTAIVTFCTGLSIIALLVFKKTKIQTILFQSFIALIFITIGMHSIQLNKPSKDDLELISFKTKEQNLIVELTEVSYSEKEWKKVLGKVHGMADQNTDEINQFPIVLYIKTHNYSLRKGDVIAIKTELNAIENAGNPGEFDAQNYWNKRGYYFMSFVGSDQFKLIDHLDENWLSRTLETLRIHLKRTLENNLSGKELSIGLALILGDKSLLDTETKNSFTNTGAMHVLAVSGLHVGIIMQILMVFLGYFSKWIKRKWALIAVVLLMWIYAFITGLSPSVLRAVFMFSVLVIAQNSGKNYNSINVLFFTGFVLILLNPYTLYDIGFQLSFLAMLGIFLFYPSIDKSIYVKNSLLKKVWQGTAIGFAAQIMTTPLSLYYFHQFPNYFVLTNIGLMASSGLILGLGLFVFSFSWLQWLAKYGAWILGLSIIASLRIIEAVEMIPGAVAYGFNVPLLLVLVLGILAMAMFLYIRNRSQRIIGVSILSVILIYIVFSRYENLTRNELCIYNSKNVIVTIKRADKLLCLHNARSPKEFEKIKLIVESYSKLYPASIQWMDIEKKNVEILNDGFLFKMNQHNENFEISLNRKKILLVSGDQGFMGSKQKVFMPWVESTRGHSLKKGAFTMEF